MAQEVLKAIDAGSKEINVNVSADGTFVSVSYPGGSFRIQQLAMEKILVKQHNEASEIKVAAKNVVVPLNSPSGDISVKKGKHD